MKGMRVAQESSTWQEILGGFIVTRKNRDGEARGFCPFHHDESPSAYYNLEKQVMDCKACSAAGDFRQIARYITQGINPFDSDKIYSPDPGSYSDAKQELSKWDRPMSMDGELTRDEVMAHFYELTMNEDHAYHYLWLLENRGLTKDAIAEYRIGIKEMTSDKNPGRRTYIYRYTIPVREELSLGEDYEDPYYETYANIRQYSADEGSTNKIINVRGHGGARLFPIQKLHQSDEIIICEGEWDAIATNIRGFTAVTGTAGADTWLPEWNEKFRGKTVYLCYDADDRGYSGMERVAQQLHGIADAVYMVYLPFDKAGADLTDMWVTYGWSPEQFQTLLDDAALYSPAPQVSTEAASETLPVYRVQNFYDHRTQDEFILEGDVMWTADAQKSSIIDSAVLTCEGKNRSACDDCAFKHQYGKRVEHVTNPKSDWVAKVVLDGEGDQKAEIAREYGVYFGKKSLGDAPCKHITFENVSHTWTTEMTLTNPPDLQENVVTESVDIVLLNDDVDVREGGRYRFRGFNKLNKKSRVYMMATTLEEVEIDLDSFEVDDYFLHQVLPQFQQQGEESIAEAAARIADRLSLTTHIYGRTDIHLTTLLTLMSALSFKSRGVVIERGWLDVLMFGDTRTGKTATAKELLKHGGMGTMASCEGSTIAGLIGGVDTSTTGRRKINWGLFPRNDRRMLVMDEMTGLQRGSKNLFSELTSLRSDGLATIQKISSGRRPARVRTLWISNLLDEMPYGITGLKPLIGKDEDLSRLDFALYVDKRDSKVMLPPQGLEPITHDEFRRMVLWAWTRKAKNINVSSEVAAEAEGLAEQLMGRLPSDPPLFGTADSGMKVQRIAVAFAILTGSTIDGETVLVTKDHIRTAIKWLESLYTRETFGYAKMEEHRQYKIEQCHRMLPAMTPIFFSYEHVLEKVYMGGASSNYMFQMCKNTEQIAHNGQKFHGTANNLLSRFGYIEEDNGKYHATDGLRAVWPQIRDILSKAN